jgi:Predicted hydrolase (metallo-beta-lactamase superfamily)
VKKRITVAITLLILLLLPLFSGASNGGRFQELVNRSGMGDRLAVYFIDLDVPEGSKDKSGDAALLITPEGKVVMIDCGHPDSFKDSKRVLDALGIKTIDVFINSHPHIDHLGAFPQIADRYEVKEVVRSEIVYPSSSYYNNFIKTIKEKGIRDTIVQKGDSFEIGSLKVEVLSPSSPIKYPDGYPANSTQFINNESLALKISFGDGVYLTCGDLYINGEKSVLADYSDYLKCNLLKANHHLNDTSSQLKWVKATKADVVVGMNDVIGSMTIYKRYVKYGATVYHTLHNGTIRVYMDREGNLEVLPQFDSWVEKGE